METGLPSNTNQTGGDNNQGNGQRQLTEFDAIMVDGQYNPAAHNRYERLRVEKDLGIPDIVQGIGAKNCKFITFERTRGGTKLELAYHPNPDGELTPDLEWVKVNAASVGSAGKFYKENAGDKIEWFCYRLEGNIYPLFSKHFREDVLKRTYKDPKLVSDFCKRIASFAKMYPHKDFTTLGCYLIMVMKYIVSADTSMSKIDVFNLLVLIAGDMKRDAGIYDNKDKGSKPMTAKDIYHAVRIAKTKPTIQKCSKDVHYKLDSVDTCALTATNTLDELEKLVEAEMERERLETEARMNALDNMISGFGNQPKAIEHDNSKSLKRPRETLMITMLNDEDSAESSAQGGVEPKRRRIETPDGVENVNETPDDQEEKN